LIRPIPIWLLRVAWLVLPLVAGPAAADALHGWANTPRIVAEILLWLSWGIGLLAVFAPRPPTLTALRTIAPAFLVLAVVVAIDGEPSTLAVIGATVATAIVAVLAAGDDIALAAANSIAYGDELRVPLRIPPALFLGPLPLARVAIVASVVAPALLLADDNLTLGVLALVIGVALLLVLGRALYGLSRRWAVLVPAGLLLHDQHALVEAVLFPRATIRRLGPARADASDAALDLTQRAFGLVVALELDEPAVVAPRRPGRTLQVESADHLLFTPTRPGALLAAAAARRIPVG
jgi:hypothetical protein